MDLQSLQIVLAQKCDLQKDALLVVGVSGGPDSLCLLHILHSQGYSVLAVHVNHQLRPEADLEAAAVENFAATLKVPFLQTRVDVKKFAQEQKLSIEESARILRYHFLMETAQEQNAQAVAVAHQADDQIETVLMHLLRGSGLSGLKGMPYRGMLPVFSSDIPIVRPLLGVWREEILEYCQQQGIQPSYDASNEDVRYFRNRIRNELVPLLKTYNEQAPQHLWQLASLVGAEDDYLLQETRSASTQVKAQWGEGYILFDLSEFKLLHLAIQRRLLRSWLAELQENLRDIGVEAIQRAEEFLQRESQTGTCQLLEGVWLSRFNLNQMVIYRSDAYFEQEFPLVKQNSNLSPVIPGIAQINRYWELKAEWVDRQALEQSCDEWSAYLDGNAASDELSLTGANTAERISYINTQEHSIKLGDLFTDKKVFPLARPRWPVVRSAEKIIWVPGLKRSNLALVTEKTKQVLKLTLRKK